MDTHESIIASWLYGLSAVEKRNVLRVVGVYAAQLPIESVLEQIAAQLFAACAEDLGLSTLELAGLLREPRNDALQGLVTVISSDG